MWKGKRVFNFFILVEILEFTSRHAVGHGAKEQKHKAKPLSLMGTSTLKSYYKLVPLNGTILSKFHGQSSLFFSFLFLFSLSHEGIPCMIITFHMYMPQCQEKALVLGWVVIIIFLFFIFGINPPIFLGGSPIYRDLKSKKLSNQCRVVNVWCPNFKS